jgi:hypothetical protein
MDVGAFVQENKRWLLGCAIGAVVWLVASSVIGSMHAVTVVKPQTPDAYDQAVLSAAKAEHEQLTALREALQRELAFVPSAKYQPTSNSGDALFRLGRELKTAISTAANSREVQFSESSVVVPPASGGDDVRATLFGLELIDELQQRLFAAHDAARAADENAAGLRAIVTLRLERQQQQRGTRGPKAGDVDVRDFLTQETVRFEFLADEPTQQGFLEACRKPGRTLVVDGWQVRAPQKPGDPGTVKGLVTGIQFKQPAAASTAAADTPPRDVRAGTAGLAGGGR